jgi:hypothetical protein
MVQVEAHHRTDEADRLDADEVEGDNTTVSVQMLHGGR